MSDVAFESDGYKIAGNLFTGAEANGDAFLFIYGWAGDQNLEAAQALAGLGHTTLTYDMRGNGDSQGDLSEFSRSDFVKDATAAYDYLRRQVGASACIGVIGNSFGSYTAAILSAEREVSCLSLRAPANYPDEGYEQPQLAQLTPLNKEWRKLAQNFSATRALRAVHDFNGRIQIIEAGADEVVASQTVKNYANAVSDKALLTYEVVPDAPHRLISDELRADYISRLVAWVKLG